MKKTSIALILCMSSTYAFSAEKIIRKCENETGGLDTYTKSSLKIFLDESGNEYGGYRVEFQYERGGMGGEQKMNQKWSNLFCRIAQSNFDCQQMGGEKPVHIVEKAGSLNVLEIAPVSVDGLTTSEGNALVFNKFLGVCRNF